MIPIIDTVLGIADKFIEDPKAKAEYKAQVLAATAEVDKAQAAINLQDAKSEHFFNRGWRPFLCWSAIFVVNYGYWLKDVINTIMHNVYGKDALGNAIWVELPAVDPTIMVALLGKLLGFGVYRSYEKIQKGKGQGLVGKLLG